MTYAHTHILLRFNGHFGTSLDKWSCGIRLGQADLPVPRDDGKLQTLVNAADAAARVFHTAAGTLASTSCFFDQVAGANIGPNGKYFPAESQTVYSTLTSTPGTGTAILPWNSAVVVSLRTAVPRGRGSNGRVYWPALSASVQSGTGRMSSGTVSGRLNAFKTFVDSLNTAANSYMAGTRVIVASNVGLGLNAVVTSLRADDRVDSIERRENDQPSAYQSVTVA